MHQQASDGRLVPAAPLTLALQEYLLKKITSPNLQSFILNTLQVLSVTRRLYSILDETLVAKFDDNTTLKLDHESFGNVDNSMVNTTEFLMTRAARSFTGYGLGELMTRYEMKSIYGPQTLKLLQQIGWATRRNSLDNFRLKVSREENEFLSKYGK